MTGIGTDIVEIARIAPLIGREAFLRRVYTASERAYLQAAPLPAQTAAGLFCAKEAVAKALGTGFGAALAFTDVEIGRTGAGAPTVAVAGRDGLRLSVSIAHCRDYATATAILWEG